MQLAVDWFAALPGEDVALAAVGSGSPVAGLSLHKPLDNLEGVRSITYMQPILLAKPTPRTVRCAPGMRSSGCRKFPWSSRLLSLPQSKGAVG